MIYVCSQRLVEAHAYVRLGLGLEWTRDEEGEYGYPGARIVCWPGDLSDAGPEDELHLVGPADGRMMGDLAEMAALVGAQIAFEEIVERRNDDDS